MELISFLVILLGVLSAPSNSVNIVQLIAELNSVAVLPCRVENGDSSTTVRWVSQKEGWLSHGTQVYKYHGTLSVDKPAPNEWNLRIDRVTTIFDDVYTCQTASGELIAKYKLVIETPPRIEESASSPVSVTIPENDLAELTCQATGVPEPTIKWYRGKVETPIGISGQKLIIRRIPRFAADLYICLASNKNGNATREINVTVSFPPEVNVMESEMFVPKGNAVSMVCLAQGFPLYQTYWKNKNGEKITTNWKYMVDEQPAGDGIPARFLNFTIRSSVISTHDYGNYTCVAVGEGHEAETPVWLRDPAERSVEGVINYN